MKYDPLTPLVRGLPDHMEGTASGRNACDYRVVDRVSYDGKRYTGKVWVRKLLSGEIDLEEIKKSGKKGYEIFVMDPSIRPLDYPDFYKQVTETGKTYAESVPGYMEETIGMNLPLAPKTPFIFPKKKVVFLVGGGPSAKRTLKSSAFWRMVDRDDTAVLTMSGSQNFVAGDYYIASELSPAGPNRLNGAHGDMEETEAVLHIHANNNYYTNFNWSKIHVYESISNNCGFEKFWSYSTVAYDAIQFAVRGLKAEHLVLIGFDGGAPFNGKYHEEDDAPMGKEFVSRGLDGRMWQTVGSVLNSNHCLEACAYLLNFRGIRTWNCTDGGIIVRNMRLCTMELFEGIYIECFSQEDAVKAAG